MIKIGGLIFVCQYYGVCGKKTDTSECNITECTDGLNRLVKDIKRENEFLKAQVAHLQSCISYDTDDECYE